MSEGSIAVGRCQGIINCFTHWNSLESRAKFSLVLQFAFMSGEYEILFAIVLSSWGFVLKLKDLWYIYTSFYLKIMKNFHISCYYSLKWWWKLTAGNHRIVKISKVRCIDFSLYVGLILWLCLGLLKSFLTGLLLITKSKTFFGLGGECFLSVYLHFLLCPCIILSMT